ncbi:MAG: hypothetical protein V4736_03590 [Bdellovibrionota bacterium]
MKFNIFLCGLSSFVFSTVAWGLSEYREFRPRTLEVSAETQYFSSNKNYDSNGKSVALLYDNSYSLIQAPFGARYIFSPHFSMRGGVEISMAESKNADPFYRGNRSNSAIDEVSAGTDYLMFDWSGWQLVTDLDVRMGLIGISNTTDEVMTHEGVTTITPSVQLQTASESFEILGNVGYRYRTGGRADLVPWAVNAGLVFGSFSFGAELAGQQSIGQDADKGTTASELAREIAVLRANGGSYRFYGINPSYMEAAGFARFRGDTWKTSIFGGTTLSGTNYAEGIFVGVNVTLAFDFGSASYMTPAKKRRSAPAEPEEEFRPSTNDGVDQNLFKPIAKPPPKKSATKKSTYQNVPAAPVQEQLDEAEMIIELKRKKK